jgi:hypothetical protein
MPVTARELLLMPGARLDELYRNCDAGPIPAGNSNGTALIWTDTWAARPIAWMVRTIFWQGKIFDPTHDTLVNKITPIGIHAIEARVYKGASWLDAKESIILDYSHTSFVAWFVRDEIRELAPSLYLGQAYIEKERFIRFAIAFATFGSEIARHAE